MFKIKEVVKKLGFGFYLRSNTEEDNYNLLFIHLIYPGFYIQIQNLIRSKEKPFTVNGKEYTKLIEREYGFNFYNDNLQIRYGIQPRDWLANDKENSDHSMVLFYPWNLEFYKSTIMYHYAPWIEMCDIKEFNKLNEEFNCGPGQWGYIPELYRYEKFTYGDKTADVKLHINKREWHRGAFFPFTLLKYFPGGKLVRKTMEIEFSTDMGPRAGEWKGGVIAMGFYMKENESIVDCWKRWKKEYDWR